MKVSSTHSQQKSPKCSWVQFQKCQNYFCSFPFNIFGAINNLIINIVINNIIIIITSFNIFGVIIRNRCVCVCVREREREREREERGRDRQEETERERRGEKLFWKSSFYFKTVSSNISLWYKVLLLVFLIAQFNWRVFLVFACLYYFYLGFIPEYFHCVQFSRLIVFIFFLLL